MAEIHVPSATAKRMWALPGAMLTGLRRPEFVNGMMMRTPQSPLIDIPCPSFLIEHNRGLVLFDTGVSPRGLADPDHYFPDLVRQLKFECRPDLGVDAQIRGLGYQLEHVKYVIPSHLHFDHAGGLFLFPHATFLVGLAASIGAGISMGFAEALSDDGSMTGRGRPWTRGLICGLMTALGGLGRSGWTSLPVHHAPSVPLRQSRSLGRIEQPFGPPQRANSSPRSRRLRTAPMTVVVTRQV